MKPWINFFGGKYNDRCIVHLRYIVVLDSVNGEHHVLRQCEDEQEAESILQAWKEESNASSV
jgi:hypothetical protein